MKIPGNAFIITGGLGGVGKAMATSILAEGGFVAVRTLSSKLWRVLILDLYDHQLFDVVDKAKGEALTAEIDAKRAFYFRVDISDPESVKKAVDDAVSKLPTKRLVGAVHCAGIALRVRFLPDVLRSSRLTSCRSAGVDQHHGGLYQRFQEDARCQHFRDVRYQRLRLGCDQRSIPLGGQAASACRRGARHNYQLCLSCCCALCSSSMLRSYEEYVKVSNFALYFLHPRKLTPLKLPCLGLQPVSATTWDPPAFESAVFLLRLSPLEWPEFTL